MNDLKSVFIIGYEFIINIVNYNKQDCEINAAKRLLPRIMNELRKTGAIFLGDDCKFR
jgi:hypothetical protein